MNEFRHGASVDHAYAGHEHREFEQALNRIRNVARAAPGMNRSDLSLAMLDVVDWIENVLDPHMRWEDAWLYPEIERRAGTCWATRLVSLEHAQLRRLKVRLETDRTLLLDHPRRAQLEELREHLLGFEALLRAHIEQEEQVLLPVLDEVREAARA